MQSSAVIIIGAGPAGLMAALTVAKGGQKALVLEARNRIGGRIHTLDDTLFFKKAELGAEFIHGDLPLTLQLLEQAGIAYEPAGGQMYRLKNGSFTTEDEQVDDWDELMHQLSMLKQDTDIATFMDMYFAGDKYNRLRKEVKRYVAGYDSADPTLASAFALRQEWESEDMGAQHRIAGGYCTLINYLADEYRAAGGDIILNVPAVKINMEADHVEVVADDGNTYIAPKVIVAAPLGVLQTGDIVFTRVDQQVTNVFSNIGFGAIIKILVQFDEPFWEELQGGELKDAGFFFADEEIPTWWTQAPQHNALLTGWLGGDNARKLSDISDDDLWHKALKALSNIFAMDADVLKDKAIAWKVCNWTADPYTRGSYAYDMVASPQARSLLTAPVADKLYFAGEYLYDGPAMGTVEAALQSGRHAGLLLIKSLNK